MKLGVHLRKRLILTALLTIFLLNIASTFGFAQVTNASPLTQGSSSSQQDTPITGDPVESSSGSTYIIGPLGMYPSQLDAFLQQLGVSDTVEGWEKVIETYFLPLNFRLVIIWVPGWGTGNTHANTVTADIQFDPGFDRFLTACDKYGVSVIFQWPKGWSYTSQANPSWDRDVYSQFPELAGIKKDGTPYTVDTTPGDLNLFMIDNPLYFQQLKQDLKQLYEYYGRHKSWIGLGQFKGDYQYYAGKGSTYRNIFSYSSLRNYVNSEYFEGVVDVNTGLHLTDGTKCKLYEMFKDSIVFEYGRWQAVIPVIYSGVYGGTGSTGHVAGFKFQAPENLEGFQIVWYGKAKGTPSSPLILELYKNKGPYEGEQPDNLGTPLESHTATVSGDGWQPAVSFNARLAKGDYYWVVFQTNGGDQNNCYQMYYRDLKNDESSFKFSYKGYTTDWWDFRGSAILKIQDKDGNDVKIYPFQKDIIKTTSSSGLTQTFTTPNRQITFNTVMPLFSDRISDQVPSTVEIKDSSNNVLASSTFTQMSLNGFPYNGFVAIPLNKRITLQPNSQYSITIKTPQGMGWQWHALETDPPSAGFEGQSVTQIFKLVDMDIALDDFMHVGGQEFLEKLGGETATGGITSTEWYAVGLVPTKSASLSKVSLYMSQIYGSPSGLVVSLYSGDETKPQSQLESKTISPSTGWNDITGWSSSLTAGNYYWIVLRSAGGSGYRPARVVNPYIWINKRSTDSGNTWGYQVEVGDLVMEVITSQERIGTSADERQAFQITNQKWIAQSFTTTTNTIVKGILLWSTKPNNDPGSDLIVEVRSDSGSDAPSSTVLTSGTLTYKDNNYRGLNYVQFDLPTTLTAGTKYWIVIRTPQFFQNSNYPPTLEVPVYFFRYPQYSYGGTTYHAKSSTNSGSSWSLANGKEGDIIFGVVKDPSLPTTYSLQELVDTDLGTYHCFSSPNPTEPLRGWNTYLNLQVDKISTQMVEWLEGYSGRKYVYITPNNYRIAAEAGGQKYAYTAEWITGPLPPAGPPEDKLIAWRAMTKVQEILRQSGLGFWPGGSLGHTWDNTGAITAEQIGLDYRLTLPLTARAVSVFDMDPQHIMELPEGDSGHTTHEGLQYWSKKYGELLGRMRYYGGYYGHEKGAVKALFIGDSDVGITPQFFTPALDITLEGFENYQGDYNLTKYGDFSQFDVIVGFSSRPSLSDLGAGAQNRIKNFITNGGGLVCFGSYPAWASEIFANAQIISVDHVINKPYTASDFIDSRPQIKVSTYGSGRGVIVTTKKGTWKDIGMPTPNPWWPFGGAPRDSIIVLATNSMFYAAKKESLLPVWWYPQYRDFQPWHHELWYSINGRPGEPVLLWLSNNNETTSFEIHLNANFYGIDPAGWLAIDVQNWEVVAKGSGTDIKVTTSVSAKSWKPIYIMNATSTLRDSYSNAFIKSRSIYSYKATYVLQGTFKQTGWLAVNSATTPLSVTANNTGALPKQTSLSILNSDSTANGWYYDSVNKLLLIKFKFTSTVEINILAKEVSYLFQSGFENQFNDWDGIEQRNSAYVKTGTQNDGFIIHHGSFSMKSASGAVSGSQSWAYKKIQHVEEVYIQLYVYFPEFWTYPNAWNNGIPGWWLYFLELTPEYPIPYSHSGKYIHSQLRAMYFTGDQAGQEGWYFQGTSYDAAAGERIYLNNPSYPNQWALNPKQWYCVELYNKLASSYGANDGIWRLWVDGQLYYDFTGLNNRDQTYPWLGAIMVGNYEVPASTNGWNEPFPTVYMDCVKISTEYIGPESEGPQPPQGKEPFKDFFDYEWWLPGAEYIGKGRQYGKWFMIEMFYVNGVPNHDFFISKENPISGTDSAVLNVDGNKQDPLCETWQTLAESVDPDSSYIVYPNLFMNPCYTRFRFRIDRWDATNSYWRVTLGELSGNENSALITQVVIALEGFSPPHLWMLYKTGSTSANWTKYELVSSTTVSLGVVHTIELYRYAHPTNGEMKVWLDGKEVSDLTVQNVDTSYPGGVRSVRIGSNAYYTKLSPGSWATITFDDLRVRNQYIGTSSLPVTYYDLTLDSSPQGKTVRVGNWIVGKTPVTIQVPEGTVPKVGIDPTNFDHWEIEGSPDYSSTVKNTFRSFTELWPSVEPPLMATVTRDPVMGGPWVTPAIYRDTRITAMYTTGKKHVLQVNSDPIAASFTVDGLDYTAPWSGSLTEGTHTIAMPSSVRVGGATYSFVRWEDGSTNPSRTITLMSDMAITAYYEAGQPLAKYSLGLRSEPITNVKITVDGTTEIYTPGSVILTEGGHLVSAETSVTRNEGTYLFSHWENGETSPSRTISLTANTTLTATYQLSLPTFGKTTIGAKTNLLMPEMLRATKFTAPRAGTLNSITIYFGNVGNYISGQPSPTKFIAGVYSEDLRLLGQSNPTSIVANCWNTGTLISPVAIEAGKFYWFAFMIDGAGAWVSGVNEPWVVIKFDEPGMVSRQTIEQTRVSWGSMPDPFPAVGASYRDRAYSIYGAYTPTQPLPPSTHTLNIYSYPISGVSFTLNGVSRATPFSTTLNEGTHTVVMPSKVTVGGTTYNFVRWEGGSTNPTRKINLASDMTLTAYYQATSSSPSPPPSSPPSSPPPSPPSPSFPTNDALSLIDPSIGTRGSLASKQAYIFQVSVSDPNGVTNLNYVDLVLDPEGRAIKVRWTESTDVWSEESDPNDYISLGECTKSIADNQVTLNFAIIFRWTYPDENVHPVRLYSLNDNDLFDTDDFVDVYYVENDLAIQNPSVNDDRVDPGQTITISGCLYYEGTAIPPPDGDYQVNVKLSDIQKGQTNITLISGHYTIIIPAEQTVGSYTYQVSCDHNASTVNTPPVIVDKLIVSITADAHEVDVGKRVNFTLTITRQYDSTNVTSFTITTTRNGTKWLTLTDPTFNDILQTPGHYTYSTESIIDITDNTYGLTTFETNKLTIKWRQKIVKKAIVNIAIQVKDQAINTSLSEASVYIKNDTWTSETKYANASGWANFTNVEIGTYTIVGEVKGYATALDTVSVTTDITHTLLLSKRAFLLAAMPIMSPDFALILVPAPILIAVGYYITQRRSNRKQ